MDLDYDLLNYVLKVDEAYVVAQKKNLVVTCLDQLDETLKLENLKMKFDAIFGSFSPYSKDFKRID